MPSQNMALESHDVIDHIYNLQFRSILSHELGIQYPFKKQLYEASESESEDTQNQ